MLFLKAFAQPKSKGGGGGTPSRNATDDDRRYTQAAIEHARQAGVRNPVALVNRNVRQNAPVASRRRVMAQINRRG